MERVPINERHGVVTWFFAGLGCAALPIGIMSLAAWKTGLAFPLREIVGYSFQVAAAITVLFALRADLAIDGEPRPRNAASLETILGIFLLVVVALGVNDEFLARASDGAKIEAADAVAQRLAEAEERLQKLRPPGIGRAAQKPLRAGVGLIDKPKKPLWVWIFIQSVLAFVTIAYCGIKKAEMITNQRSRELAELGLSSVADQPPAEGHPETK